MDWQIVVAIIISVGAIIAYFAMGEDPEARVDAAPQSRESHAETVAQRKVQFVAEPTLRETPRVDSEILDRFVEALKAQDRQSDRA